MSDALLLTAYETVGTVGMVEYKKMFKQEILDTDNIPLCEYQDFLREERPDDEFWPMDELDDVLDSDSPTQAIQRAFFGDFRFNDDYFRFNGYANLESLTEGQLKKEMANDDDFLDWYIEKENLIDEEEAQSVIDEANKLIRLGY